MIITPNVPALFKHYKDTVYRLRGFMLNTYDDSTLVLYSEDSSGDEGRLYATPADRFFGQVVVSGTYIPRFLLISP